MREWEVGAGQRWWVCRTESVGWQRDGLACTFGESFSIEIVLIQGTITE